MGTFALLRGNTGRMELQVPLESLGLLEHLEREVILDLPDLKEARGQSVIRDPRETVELVGIKETRGHLASLEYTDLTALS